jgi:hypothetical protein
MYLRETISWLKAKIQSDLFPHLEENFKDPLTEKALAKVYYPLTLALSHQGRGLINKPRP